MASNYILKWVCALNDNGIVCTVFEYCHRLFTAVCVANGLRWTAELVTSN